MQQDAQSGNIFEMYSSEQEFNGSKMAISMK